MAETIVVDAPEEPASPDVKDPSSGFLNRLSGPAITVLVLVPLLLLVVLIWFGWDFIVSTDEAGEEDDWEQLLALIDRADSLAVFILGAAFGISVQAGRTTEAAAVAKGNKDAAEEQHRIATANHGAAQTARAAADAQNEKVRAAVPKVKKVIELAERRKADGSKFLTVPAASEWSALRRDLVQGSTPNAQVLQVISSPAEVDPELEAAAQEATAAIGDLEAVHVVFR